MTTIWIDWLIVLYVHSFMFSLLVLHSFINEKKLRRCTAAGGGKQGLILLGPQKN
jgi:hypothetical protein